MRALIIGGAEQEDIADLKLFAAANRITHEMLMRTVNREGIAIGDDTRYSVQIPDGYRVVYTHEEQPGGLVQHISVSVNTPGKAPSVPAMDMILEAFGFKGRVGSPDIMMWVEEQVGAINALELLEN